MKRRHLWLYTGLHKVLHPVSEFLFEYGFDFSNWSDPDPGPVLAPAQDKIPKIFQCILKR